jgi:hypothetical protein
MKHAGTLNFVASFFSVFSDWISLKVPNRTAYYYRRAYPNRFKLRHSAQFPKFPGKGIGRQLEYLQTTGRRSVVYEQDEGIRFMDEFYR